MKKYLSQFEGVESHGNKFLLMWELLSKKYQHLSIAIIFITLLGTVFETFGVGLVIPAMALLVDQNISEKYPFIYPLLVAIGHPPHAILAIYGMLFLVFSYVIKAIYLAYMSWKQAEYVYEIKAYLSQRLFEKYLLEDYDFHLNNNSALLIRNITTEVGQLVDYFFSPLVLILTESTVIIALSFLLFYVEPVGAFFLIATAAVSMIFFQGYTRNKVALWGKERQIWEGLRIQKAQEGLGGAKDVKLLGRERSFIAQYNLYNFNASIVERKQLALSQMPRLWLETLGVIGLSILVSVVIFRSGQPADVLPTIGLFAAAAFRIIPSANRLMISMQYIRYSNASIELIESELTDDLTALKVVTGQIDFQKEVVLDNVSYFYPNTKFPAIKNICFAIKKGESVGLIGQSGAGKSTLVDLILGLLAPSSGTIKVDGINIRSNLRGWQDLIGYVPQSIFLADDTLARNIAFGLADSDINMAAIWNAIKLSQLEHFVSTLPDGINTFVGERGVRLSGGQRQRIGLARALYHSPQVLVFDEATSALDSETEADVMAAISSLMGDRTIIIIAHRLTTIDNCDVVYAMSNGSIERVNSNDRNCEI